MWFSHVVLLEAFTLCCCVQLVYCSSEGLVGAKPRNFSKDSISLCLVFITMYYSHTTAYLTIHSVLHHHSGSAFPHNSCHWLTISWFMSGITSSCRQSWAGRSMAYHVPASPWLGSWLEMTSRSAGRPAVDTDTLQVGTSSCWVVITAIG